jgi:predicted DNA-binding transcriptional regulator AlpA
MLAALLTEKQLADRTGIPAKTWQYLRYSGKGPAYVRVGGGRLIRYAEEDVEIWLRQHQQHSTSENGATRLAPGPTIPGAERNIQSSRKE